MEQGVIGNVGNVCNGVLGRSATLHLSAPLSL